MPLNHDPTLLEYEGSAAGDDTSEDEADDVGQDLQGDDPPRGFGLDGWLWSVVNNIGLRIENDRFNLGYLCGYRFLDSFLNKLRNDFLIKLLHNNTILIINHFR